MQWLWRNTLLGKEFAAQDGVSVVGVHSPTDPTHSGVHSPANAQGTGSGAAAGGGYGYVILTTQGNMSDHDIVQNMLWNSASWWLSLNGSKLVFQQVHPGRAVQVEPGFKQLTLHVRSTLETEI